jgi:GTP-binding protein HflX
MAAHETAPTTPRALLVGIQLPNMNEHDLQASLAELSRLVHTLGFDVVHTLTQKRGSSSSPTVLGEGKLRELAALTGGSGVVPSGAKRKPTKAALKWQSEDGDEEEVILPTPEVKLDEAHKPTVVVVDAEMTPSQMSNLQKATGVEVMDRTGVIIRIFHRHAHTREARLQVEIARLTYEAPRLREKESLGDRQRGGGVGGKGDTEVELDKRRIRDRIAELRHELETLHVEQDTRRARRRDKLKVALVGYTNAGKSSLMRALTGSEVLVADKLFATLGTTVRALQPETQPRILVSDTVGFIRNLPHDLVASFRSTLDEAGDASLLLFVVDGSDPAFESQLEVTRTVLGEIGATGIPSRLILNKMDRLDVDARAALRKKYPDAIQLSAHSKEDVAALRLSIVEVFEEGMEEKTLTVPYSKAGVIGEIRQNARVIKEDYVEEGTLLTVRGPAEMIARFESLLLR